MTTDIAEPLSALNELDQLADLTGTEFSLSESHVDDFNAPADNVTGKNSETSNLVYNYT